MEDLGIRIVYAEAIPQFTFLQNLGKLESYTKQMACCWGDMDWTVVT